MKIIYLDYPKALCITDCTSWEIGAQTVDYLKDAGFDIDAVYIEVGDNKTNRLVLDELLESIE